MSLGLALAVVWQGAALADVSAALDRRQLYEGSALTLTIEATGQAQDAEPDLTPLQDDFDILGTSRSSQISIINGRGSSRLQWLIRLAPKRLGDVRIPSIEVGDQRTEPLEVRVDAVPEDGIGGPGDDVFVEMQLEGASDEPVVVQQQLPLVVRLYSALPLRGGTLTDPRPEGAVIERLGPDQRSSVTRDGRDYQVIERRYSLSPERSGELRVPPVVFEGEMVPGAASGSTSRGTQTPRMDRMFQDFPFASDFAAGPLSLFEPGEPVRAQSGALTLKVAARPETFSGRHWLPAEALTVSDSWQQDPPSLRVGEPAVRSLTLTAKGLAGSQIPDVDMQVPEDVRAYREPTENQTRTDGQVVYAVSAQSMTLIPTRAGPLQLPELRVRWWDINAQQERETRIPAVTLEVAPGAAGSTLPPEKPAEPAVASNADSAPDEKSATAQPPALKPEPRGTDSKSDIGLLFSAFLGLLVLAAVGVAAMVAAKRRGLLRSSPARAAVGQGERAVKPPQRNLLRERVRQAALENDPRGAADALLALSRACWPNDPPLNLTILARRSLEAREISEPAARTAQDAILALERALYAPAAQAWDGAGFWDSIKASLCASADDPGQADDDTELPPLYPERR